MGETVLTCIAVAATVAAVTGEGRVCDVLASFFTSCDVHNFFHVPCLCAVCLDKYFGGAMFGLG